MTSTAIKKYLYNWRESKLKTRKYLLALHYVILQSNIYFYHFANKNIRFIYFYYANNVYKQQNSNFSLKERGIKQFIYGFYFVTWDVCF